VVVSHATIVCVGYGSCLAMLSNSVCLAQMSSVLFGKKDAPSIMSYSLSFCGLNCRCRKKKKRRRDVTKACPTPAQHSGNSNDICSTLRLAQCYVESLYLVKRTFWPNLPVWINLTPFACDVYFSSTWFCPVVAHQGELCCCSRPSQVSRARPSMQPSAFRFLSRAVDIIS